MTRLELDDIEALAGVSDTGLLTLFGRARETRVERGTIDDPMAVALADALVPVLAASDRPMHRRLARGRVPALLGAYLGLRARYFDARALEFLARRPGAVIVNLGCGMDTRFHRLARQLDDPTTLELVDVDLEPVIAIKARVLPPEGGYRQLAADVGDTAWLDALPLERPLMFLAEGLLMYLEPERVRALVLAIHARAPGSELVAEIFNQRWLEGWRKRVIDQKLRKQMSIEAGTTFRFGVHDARELEGWAPGIELLGEWSFMDERSPRTRAANWMRHFDGLRRMQWVAHWRLGH